MVAAPSRWSDREPVPTSSRSGRAGQEPMRGLAWPGLPYAQLADEGGLARGLDGAEHVALVEDLVREEQLELVPQRRAQEIGAVGVDGRAHPGVAEALVDLAELVPSRDGAGPEVRRRAELEHRALVAQPLHELLAAGCGDAMADAVGLELLQDGEHAVRSRVRGLARVNGRAQPSGPRAGEEVVVAIDVAAELERVLLRAREVDAHHAAVPVALGLPHDDVVQRVVELAGETEDQPRADAVREARALHPVDGRGDDVVEVPLAAQVPLHRVEAELDGRDAR